MKRLRLSDNLSKSPPSGDPLSSEKTNLCHTALDGRCGVTPSEQFLHSDSDVCSPQEVFWPSGHTVNVHGHEFHHASKLIGMSQ